MTIKNELETMCYALALQKEQLESQYQRVTKQLGALDFQAKELERLIGRLETQKNQLTMQADRMRDQVKEIDSQVTRIETMCGKLTPDAIGSLTTPPKTLN
jgi:chromosome segregation ATPase